MTDEQDTALVPTDNEIQEGSSDKKYPADDSIQLQLDNGTKHQDSKIIDVPNDSIATLDGEESSMDHQDPDESPDELAGHEVSCQTEPIDTNSIGVGKEQKKSKKKKKWKKTLKQRAVSQPPGQAATISGGVTLPRNHKLDHQKESRKDQQQNRSHSHHHRVTFNGDSSPEQQQQLHSRSSSAPAQHQKRRLAQQQQQQQRQPISNEVKLLQKLAELNVLLSHDYRANAAASYQPGLAAAGGGVGAQNHLAPHQQKQRLITRPEAGEGRHRRLPPI